MTQSDRELADPGTRMPELFVGHGSPTNAIEDNEFSRSWADIGRRLPRPTAILCISAHWETEGTHVAAMETPKTIHGERYNLSTALRQSWTTPFTEMLFYWWMPLAGFHPAMVLAAKAWSLIVQGIRANGQPGTVYFIHSHHRIELAPEPEKAPPAP